MSEGALRFLAMQQDRLSRCQDCGCKDDDLPYGKCEKCLNKHYGHKPLIKKQIERRGESFKQWLAKIIANAYLFFR